MVRVICGKDLMAQKYGNYFLILNMNILVIISPQCTTSFIWVLNIPVFLWQLKKLLPYQISFWIDFTLGNKAKLLMHHNFQKDCGHRWQKKMELSETMSTPTDCHVMYPDAFPPVLFFGKFAVPHNYWHSKQKSVAGLLDTQGVWKPQRKL